MSKQRAGQKRRLPLTAAQHPGVLNGREIHEQDREIAMPTTNQPAGAVCPGFLAVPPTRRQLLAAGANGFGLLALSALLAERGFAAASRVPGPHFKEKAKHVIFCFMDGGVSHVDSFDPKPEL